MKRLLLSFSLCFLCVISLFADNLTVGRKYYNEAKSGYGSSYYQKALPYLQNAAKEGYGEACYLLGTMYYWGLGIEPNYPIAKNMFEKSIQFGYNLGEAELGLMYENGKGVGKDMEKAISLYKKSTDKDLSIGKYFLSMAYMRGNNIDGYNVFQLLKSISDTKQTDPLPYMHWYDWVEYYSGICYEFGIGVKADFKEALKKYDNTYCSTGGLFVYTEYRAYLLRYANEAHKQPEHANGDREPIWPYRLQDCIRSSESTYGSAVNYYRLYKYFSDGDYLIKAAEKGYGPAQRRLAECYRDGSDGVSINLIKAKEMEQKADEWFAEHGEDYGKELRIETDAEYRNSLGIYMPGDTWESPLGWSFRVKNVDTDGKPFGIPSDDEIKKLLAEKERQSAAKERADEMKILDSDEGYRNSKGIYRFGDLFKDNKGDYYVVLSVDADGKPKELMDPEYATISYESYAQGNSRYVLSPSDFEAVNNKFDEINAKLAKAGAPQLVRYAYITNYKTGSVIWKQTFNRRNVGEYVESKSLAGKNINVMTKYKYSDLKNFGLVD